MVLVVRSACDGSGGGSEKVPGGPESKVKG